MLNESQRTHLLGLPSKLFVELQKELWLIHQESHDWIKAEFDAGREVPMNQFSPQAQIKIDELAPAQKQYSQLISWINYLLTKEPEYTESNYPQVEQTIRITMSMISVLLNEYRLQHRAT